MRSETKMVSTFTYFGFISALVVLSSSDALSEHANHAIKIVVVTCLLFGTIFAVFGAENKEKKGEK